jgi:hypothetical protein
VGSGGWGVGIGGWGMGIGNFLNPDTFHTLSTFQTLSTFPTPYSLLPTPLPFQFFVLGKLRRVRLVVDERLLR